MHEGTTDDEAGTSDPSGKRGRHLVRVLSVYGKNRLGRPWFRKSCMHEMSTTRMNFWSYASYCERKGWYCYDYGIENNLKMSIALW